jgi:hypothetical protein
VGALGDSYLSGGANEVLSNKTVKTFKLKLASMPCACAACRGRRRTKKHASSKEFGMNEKNGFIGP